MQLGKGLFMVSEGSGLTYRSSGVDIEAGTALVQAIAPLARATRRTGADGALGGFGALFDLKACGFSDPLLVAATDGVGTKLKIALEMGLHEGVGIDLVAMSVNDLLVQGAEPLLFLDYFATGRLDVDQARAVISGVAEGCRRAGCVLAGGETAEMPGFYPRGEYDIAGFALGAVERDRLLPRPTLESGDVLLGLASSGLHSNGYSLVRRLVEREGYSYHDDAPFAPGVSLGRALLEPTRIYVSSVLSALRADHGIKALCHITGGGILENIPRVLPSHLAASFSLSSWPLPTVFSWMREAGTLSREELLKTFNCGLGMVVVVPRASCSAVVAHFSQAGERVFEIGELVAKEPSGHAVVVSGDFV